MPPIRLLSAAEQVAAQLRAEMVAGLRGGLMPGVHLLAEELGVNHKTVDAALRLLEREGLLVNQGARRRRLINAACGSGALAGLRVALLPMDAPDRGEDFVIELRLRLEEAGHVPVQAGRRLLELDMDATKVARLVGRTRADAWIVVAGSRGVLEWFAGQPQPTFALFGRFEGLPIAAAKPDKSAPVAAATRRLIGLGHRRITLLIRRQHRHPEPSPVARAFLDELASHDVRVGDFNLPEWAESRAGYQAILESLFRTTPPTALLTDEAFPFIAAQQFLARRGLRIPEDVSLLCTDNDPTFAWCEPSVAHIRWDYQPVVARVVRWAANVSCGKRDLRQTLTKAEFVPGGTVGTAPPG